MRRARMIGAIAAALLWPAAAQAQAPGEFSIQLDNDLFNPFTEQTDRYYTQGARVEWLRSSQRSGREFLPGIDHAAWCSLICGAGAGEGNVNTGFAIGQEIYTPNDAAIARAQPSDRPWGGLLYASRIARISYNEPRLRAERQDRIELTLGVVGPASLAEHAQVGWHKLWNFYHPAGWANQLRNEPVLQLRYETALRWQTPGRHADVTPRLRMTVGNALVSLEAEVTARIGWNLPRLGAPAPAGIAGAAAAPGRPGGGNLFLRAGLKAVAHNIFLDGNTFVRNDIRIERTPLVPELAGGVEASLDGNFWLILQFVHRGSEFETLRGRRAYAQDFGTITFAWRFGG